jgi:hypothetical protein
MGEKLLSALATEINEKKIRARRKDVNTGESVKRGGKLLTEQACLSVAVLVVRGTIQSFHGSDLGGQTDGPRRNPTRKCLNLIGMGH